MSVLAACCCGSPPPTPYCISPVCVCFCSNADGILCLNWACLKAVITLTEGCTDDAADFAEVLLTYQGDGLFTRPAGKAVSLRINLDSASWSNCGEAKVSAPVTALSITTNAGTLNYVLTDDGLCRSPATAPDCNIATVSDGDEQACLTAHICRRVWPEDDFPAVEFNVSWSGAEDNPGYLFYCASQDENIQQSTRCGCYNTNSTTATAFASGSTWDNYVLGGVFRSALVDHPDCGSTTESCTCGILPHTCDGDNGLALGRARVEIGDVTDCSLVDISTFVSVPIYGGEKYFCDTSECTYCCTQMAGAGMTANNVIYCESSTYHPTDAITDEFHDLVDCVADDLSVDPCLVCPVTIVAVEA